MSSLKIRTVTVVGANGTMGCNVSAIFASFGNAKVYMVSRNINDSKIAAVRAAKSVRADAIIDNLIPADYSMLADCVSKSDLVFESVKEDLNIKKGVTKQIIEALPQESVVCSGTSGLSITTLSECFPEDKRPYYFGVHMFNPPYNMNLCELIPTKFSDETIKNELKDYLSKTLYRTVVEVEDSPAFLANRIGFQFINKALQYANMYKDNGGVDYIDAILGPFTGRNMPPLGTADFVGLDVTKAIVDNLYNSTKDFASDTFALPHYVNNLINQGRLGRKSKSGLYRLVRYDNGQKNMTVYDISSDSYRDEINYVFPFAEKMIQSFKNGSYNSAFKALINNHSIEAELCVEFLLDYVIYSISATEEVGYNIHSADDVMANGFNWCPPLAVRDAFAEVTDFNALVKERVNYAGIDIDYLLNLAEPSKYDYRTYFKARK